MISRIMLQLQPEGTFIAELSAANQMPQMWPERSHLNKLPSMGALQQKVEEERITEAKEAPKEKGMEHGRAKACMRSIQPFRAGAN